ncbi:TetR/AcrR family transcriptional regulator [Desulfatitalea alkaliphila]|uniref:TetR/AcrR family transcriptional regulator n=1 Tax=Desulfatitalea alkaliphila TaxID=2929485 RepID=A0AA41UI23_9BACT|nr:TetR/AcrR family transcriptional regulator [Desulfatitalea alkaliphila]MCJ8499197.1 TetR/AcrR family transcriptional regulator [Desulfatitalea alkaliphila]
MRKKIAGNGDCAAAEKSGVYQKRRTQIIEKAAKLFAQKGYAQTSMREISKATGIDLSNLYYFIESKEEILFRVFEMIHRPESSVFENPAIMGLEDPAQQLRAVIREMMRFSFRYKEEVLLLYRESKQLPKMLRKEILIRENGFIREIEAILRKGVEKKIFVMEDPAFTADMIAYELSFFPLRSWNLKHISKEALIQRVEAHIMGAITV